MIKIPISSTYQQINLLTTFKNGNTVIQRLQQTPNAATEPTVEEGVDILRSELFSIPNDGKQYWIKMANGYGHIFVDYNSVEGTEHETGTSTFVGGADLAGYKEITLAVDPGVQFQAVVIVDEDDERDAGEITVKYVGTDIFRVYNTGDKDIAFSWKALIN